MAAVYERSSMLSQNGKTQLAVHSWKSDVLPVKGIVQLSHGMCDYCRRYSEMALYLADRGYLVCGNDHLGHGDSAPDPADRGYFAEKDGYLVAVDDLHALTLRLRAQYPGVPLVLFGHSMGSFFARVYAERFIENGADGYIFCGTGGPNPAAGAGIALINILSKFKGERHRSKLITSVAFGSYNKRYQSAPTGYEWVTGDEEKLAEYVADEYCMFTFTLSAYRDLMRSLAAVNREAWAGRLNKALPYLLVCGADDPVGDYGKGVKTVYDRMLAAGCGSTQLKIYDGIRHEPHNERNRTQFFNDIACWLDAAVGGNAENKSV